MSRPALPAPRLAPSAARLCPAIHAALQGVCPPHLRGGQGGQPPRGQEGDPAQPAFQMTPTYRRQEPGRAGCGHPSDPGVALGARGAFDITSSTVRRLRARAARATLSGAQAAAGAEPDQPSSAEPRRPALLSAPPAPSPPPNETDCDDQEDVPEQLGAQYTGQELLPHGRPRFVQGGQDGHRVALPHGPLRGRLHAHDRGLPPQVLLDPRRGLPARHPRHVRQPPVPRHAAPLHPHWRRFHSRVQPGQPRLLRGGAEAQAADPRHQVLPQEQNQGERGRAPGRLRQQGRPGLLPRGGAVRDPAAGGRRPPALRLLRDLGQEEQQPGPDVPGALRHGQAAQRDEPGPAPQGVRAVLRRAAQDAAAEQEAAARGRRRPGGRVRHRGALRAQAQRAQRPAVRPREGRRPGQGQGALRDQLGARPPRPRRPQNPRRTFCLSQSLSGPAPYAPGHVLQCRGVFPPQTRGPPNWGGENNREGPVICSGRKENWIMVGPPPIAVGARHPHGSGAQAQHRVRLPGFLQKSQNWEGGCVWKPTSQLGFQEPVLPPEG